MIRKQRNINVGAAILLIIFCLLFFALAFRFISIQVTGEVSGHALAAKAQQKYTKQGVLKAKRGTIYDRNGEVIAEDTTSYTLVAILDESVTTDKDKPHHVVDKEKTAKELSKYINLSESEILKTLSKKGLFQVEFGPEGKNISIQTKQEIEKLNLPGITFVQDSKRFYPNGVFSSHLIGFVDGETSTGQLGIEKQFDNILAGKDGKINYQTDKWGYLLPDGKEAITPARNGNDIYLTIDKRIQTFLEDSLNQVQKEYSPENIVAIVADAKTGEILAMGQRPTFNPETRKGIKKTWHNIAIENSFEPGSTMKVFTLASALEENVLNLNEYYNSGSYKVTKNSKAIHDHNNVGWGSITFLEGVQRSSNVAFAKIVNEKLGFDTYREYLTKFGFDRPTGIELPNETGGKIVYNYPLDKITTGYGQGTAITPIQQIQAATAIAGDGKMLKPQIIKKIVDADNGKTVKETKAEVVGNPISENTAKKVREVLETVITSPKGTGYERYNIDGYDIAGKTGTANITENGRYLRGKNDYVYSFLGMAPADDPELIVYVAVKQPKTNWGEGWKPVSEIFRPVMKNSLQYLNIQPTKQARGKNITLPDVTNLNVKEGKKQLTGLGADVIILGNGDKIVHQLPVKNQSILKGEKVVLLTEGEIRMPDMSGWSLRDAMKVANLTKLELNIKGSGYVTGQNLKPGVLLRTGDQLVLQLQTADKLAEAGEKK